MERVQGEQGGNDGATPDCARHAAEQHEEQDGVGGVEQQARQVVAARAQAEQLAVQQEGQPGQRMPEARIQGCERPAKVSPGQALLDMGVLVNIDIVIKGDKAVVQGREERPDDERK